MTLSIFSFSWFIFMVQAMKGRAIAAILFLLAGSGLYAQSDTELDAITVEGDRRPATTIERAGTVSNVTALDIDEKSSKVLKDTLTQIPGMHVTTERKGTRSFSMRGYGMDKVAILVDGVPVIDPFSGSFDIDSIGLLDVSEIIISRGTSSALYGTKGAAGFINIIKAPPKVPYVRLNAEADHLGNHFLSAAHGASFGGFYYMLSASYDKSYGYEPSERLTYGRRAGWLTRLSDLELRGRTIDYMLINAPSEYKTVNYYLSDTGKWDYNDHTRYKTNFKLGYRFTEKIEAGVTGFYNHSRMRKSIYHSDARSFWRTAETAAPYNFWGFMFGSYLANMSNRWPKYDDWSFSPYFNYTGGKLSVKGNVYYYGLNNKFVQYGDPQEVTMTSVGESSTNSRTGNMVWSIWTNQTAGFTVMPSYKFSDSHRLNLALNWYYTSHVEEEQAISYLASRAIIESRGRRPYKDMDIRASYLTIAAEYEYHHRYFDLSAGVSYDAQDLMTYKRLSSRNYRMIDVYQVKDDSVLYGTRDSLNPVIGIVSEPFKDFLKVRGSLSYKTAFPSLQAYSRVTSSYQDEGIRTNDMKVKPEKSINGNVGGELSLLNKSLVISLDWFYSFYIDKMIRFYQTRIRDYVYRNVDGAYLTGTETAITYSLYDIAGWLDLSAGLTHTLCVSRNKARVENSNINKGKYFEFQPTHKFTVDFRAVLPRTGTSLFIFGYLEYDQIFYTMKYLPENPRNGNVRQWRTDCFKPTQLNNPLMIDAKLSQKIRFFEDYELELYVMCKNIFDDYLADPFNPGPGRTWCFGAKASWN